jgi:hypothetical protein
MMSQETTRKLHVLLSQADAARFGLPDAGHTTMPVSEAVQSGVLSSLFGSGFTAVEVPADFTGGEAEIPAGHVLRRVDEVKDASSVFMFRSLVGG